MRYNDQLISKTVGNDSSLLSEFHKTNQYNLWTKMQFVNARRRICF